MASNRVFSMAFELGGRLASSFGRTFQNAESRMNRLRTASDQLNSISARTAGGVVAIGGAFAAATVGAIAFIDSVAQADTRLKSLSDSVGANAQHMEYFGAAIAPMGMDFEAAIDMQEEFINKWGESRSLFKQGLASGMSVKDAASEAVGGMADSYAMLGLDVAKSFTMPVEDALIEFQNAVLSSSNSSVAQSAADIMMGGEANKVFGYLRSTGLKTIDDLNSRFSALDFRTEESRENLQKFSNAMGTVRFAANSIKNQFAGLLGKALTPLIQKTTEWIGANKALIGQKLEQYAKGFANSLEWVVTNFEKIVFWAKAIGIVVGIFTTLSLAISAVTIAVTVFNAVMMINPFTWIIIGIAAVAVGIYALIQRFGGFTAIWEKLKATFSGFIGFAKNFIQQIDTVFANNPILNFLIPIVGIPRIIIANWSGIVGFFSGVWTSVKTLVSTAWQSMITTITNSPLLSSIQGVWNGVMTFLSSLGGRMLSIGSNIMGGLIDGIKSKFEGLKSIWNTVNSFIPDFARKKMDIHSPSRVMAEIGGHITGGLSAGIRSGFPDVESSMNGGMNSLMPDMTATVGAVAGRGASSNFTVTIQQIISGGADVAEQAKQGTLSALDQVKAQHSRENRVSFA